MKILLVAFLLVHCTQGNPMRPDLFFKDSSLVVLPQKFKPMVGIDCEQRCRDHTTEGTTCECNVTPQPTIAPPMVNGQCDMNCDQRCKDDTTEGTCCTCGSNSTTPHPTIAPPLVNTQCDFNCEELCHTSTADLPWCCDPCGSHDTTPTIAPPLVNAQCDLNCEQRCEDGTAADTCCTCGSTDPTIKPPLMVTGPVKGSFKLDPFSPTCIQRCAAGQGEPICECESDGPNEQSVHIERFPKKAILPAMVYKRQRIPPIENHYP